MDTTKEYIKMCKQAKEIQALKPNKIRDFNNKDYRAHDGEARAGTCSIIWLPRQDQLQEMVMPVSLGELLQCFYTWFKRWELESKLHEFVTATMEQLWLAFVMKELYNKRWNGEDWIN